MDALESVEVTMRRGSNSAFQMSLKFTSRSALNDIFLIATGPTSALSLGKIPLRVIVDRDHQRHCRSRCSMA